MNVKQHHCFLLFNFSFSQQLGIIVDEEVKITDKKKLTGNFRAMSSPLEDKKCRLCGYADQKNVNMFNAPNKGLVSKIRSVFPILLYEHDPLPKHICKKCSATVSFMFLDIQRVMKMQEKWISNVRCNQPNHNYICILDMIESAHRDTKKSIKTILHEDVPKESIERISLSFPTIESSKKKNVPLTPKLAPKEEPAPTATQFNNNLSFPVHIKVEPNENVPNQLKTCVENSDLQINGCIQKKPETVPCQTKRAAAVAAAVACTSQLLEREPKTRKFEYWGQVKKDTSSNTAPKAKRPKQQPISSNVTLINNMSSSPCKVKQQLLKEPAKQAAGIKCPLCFLNFKSTIELAAHQVLHLRLQLPKIFVRKCLPKKERRGRLLNLNDKQCIRCLNCWRLFENNKTILSHWSQSDCGFYCQICGKEFAHAPKMLREHVPAAHGVSYRSTKLQYARFAPPLMESNQQKLENNTDFLTTLKSKEYKQEEMRIKKVTKSNPQKRAACSICNLLFHNMMARNSHMRKHKKKKINLTDVQPEEIKVQTKHEIREISESVKKQYDKPASIAHADFPLKPIKIEPLEIEDISGKCQVCNNILTDSLDQHACF